MKKFLASLAVILTLLSGGSTAQQPNLTPTEALKSVMLLWISNNDGQQGSCTADVIDGKRGYVLTKAHCNGDYFDLFDNEDFHFTAERVYLNADPQVDTMVLFAPGLAGLYKGLQPGLTMDGVQAVVVVGYPEGGPEQVRIGEDFSVGNMAVEELPTGNLNLSFEEDPNGTFLAVTPGLGQGASGGPMFDFETAKILANVEFGAGFNGVDANVNFGPRISVIYPLTKQYWEQNCSCK